MTSAFEREYRDLDTLKGVSLHDNLLLYSVTDEQPREAYLIPEIGAELVQESDAEADRRLMECIERLRAAHLARKKNRFSVAGCLWFLALAVFVMWMAYCFVAGW